MPELIFIAIIALIVLGPQRLPGVLREVAKFIGQLRGMVSELTSQFSEEIAMLEELDPRKLIDEVTQPINDLTKPLPDKKPEPEKKPETSKAAEATATSVTTSTKVAKSSAVATEVYGNASSDENVSEVEDASTVDSDSLDDARDDDADSDEEKKGPQPKFQTDPSNVASTEPYKNRTPNLNVIKRPSKDDSKDGKEDLAVDIDPAEENQIAPPAMQEKLAKEQLEQEGASKATAASSKIADGSTATQLLSGKAVNGNGSKPKDADLSADESTASGSNLSDSSADIAGSDTVES